MARVDDGGEEAGATPVKVGSCEMSGRGDHGAEWLSRAVVVGSLAGGALVSESQRTKVLLLRPWRLLIWVARRGFAWDCHGDAAGVCVGLRRCGGCTRRQRQGRDGRWIGVAVHMRHAPNPRLARAKKEGEVVATCGSWPDDGDDVGRHLKINIFISFSSLLQPCHRVRRHPLLTRRFPPSRTVER